MMNLKPGDRIIYHSGYGNDEGGRYTKTTTTEHGEVRHWFYFDTQPTLETYVTNFERITREYTAEDHDLQRIS